MNFIKKLKEIEDKTFTFKEIYKGVYKSWDNTTKTMNKKDSITPEEKAMVNSLGYPMWKYVIDTVITIDGEDFGCPFSYSQLKEMKTKANVSNDSDLVGKTFESNNNGQEGKEIRYYFKLIKPKTSNTKEVDIDDIDFDK